MHSPEPAPGLRSTPDVFLGATLKVNAAPYHTAIVVSDPAVTGGVIIMIRLTGLTEQWDDCCVLTSADYSKLTKDTVPAYSRATQGDAIAMQKAIEAEMFTVLDPIPRAALNKILKGARETDQLSAAMLRHIALPDCP